MSKKVRKVTGSCWDFTTEDQEKMADELYELEKGNISIMSIVSKNVPTLVKENGLTDDLEDQIVKDMLSHASNSSSKDDHYNEEYANTYEDEHKLNPIDSVQKPKVVSSEIEPTLDKPVKHQNTENNECREFRIIRNNVMDSLKRFIIDDGIVPTAVSFNTFSVEELSVKIDADQAGAICADMSNYIITLKHPTAIYDAEDFYSNFWKFTRVKNDDYDRSRYFFAQANGYVFCWLLNTVSMNELNKLIFNQYSDSIEDALIAYIEMCYSAGTLNQAFFIDDLDYIKKLFNSEENQQKLFHQIFTSDLSTLMVEAGKSETEDDGVHPYDVVEVQTTVRNTISYLVGDITEEEFLDTIESDDEDEFSDLSDGMDMVDTEDNEGENKSDGSGIDVMEPSEPKDDDLIIKVKH